MIADMLNNKKHRLFIQTANLRKPLFFWCFQGVKKETNTIKLAEGTSIKCVLWVLDSVLDINFPLIQGQDKNLLNVEIRSISKTLKTWNPYVTVLITILQMILKMYSIIYKYFLATLERNIFKKSISELYWMGHSLGLI